MEFNSAFKGLRSLEEIGRTSVKIQRHGLIRARSSTGMNKTERGSFEK
jgi:hypothetical protein